MRTVACILLTVLILAFLMMPRAHAGLSWEQGHPERAEWSTFVEHEIDLRLESLDLAKDVKLMRPDYRTLSRKERVMAWGELISAMTKFESDWNPKQSSIDVGKPGDKNTYSVGLLQVSVTDQDTLGMRFGYSFEDLKTPFKNLRLGVALLDKQIRMHGKIFIAKGEQGLYWAVLHPGGRFDKSSQIIAMVKRLKFNRSIANEQHSI